MKIWIRSALMGAAAVLMLIAGSPAFAGDVIHNGVDLWMTVAGFARTSFAQEPIPAGFFCEGSQPFTGTVTFKGVPLAMEPARSLGSIDTVVRRLDDVTFNDKGEGSTRIQLMALSLASTQPIETSCGKYDVAVSLAPGEQPTTTMRIVRTDALGGTYTAPLALNVKAVFTPVAGSPGARRELTRRIELGPGSHSVWAYVTTPQYPAGVRIDTNGDGKPDTSLPASTSFKAGLEPAVLKGQVANPRPAYLILNDCTCPSPQCPYQSCHCDPNSVDPFNPATGCDHLHCIWTCANVPGRSCVCGLSAN
jgi:hypothetical protein